jgi:hypothetical protein
MVIVLEIAGLEMAQLKLEVSEQVITSPSKGVCVKVKLFEPDGSPLTFHS